MADRPRRLLAYDQDCRLCRAAVDLIGWLGLVPRVDSRPWESFDPDTSARLMRAGIHNELAVVDPATREVKSGYRGLLWKLEEGRLRPLARLLALPLLVQLGTAAYRTIAYNRRILSPLRSDGPRCACDPDPSRLWRAALVLPCLAFAGWALVQHVELLHAGAGGWALVLAAALAVLIGVNSADLDEAALLDRAGNLAWCSAIAALWLLVSWWVASWVPSAARTPVLVLGLVAALADASRRIVERLDLSRDAPVNEGLVRQPR